MDRRTALTGAWIIAAMLSGGVGAQPDTVLAPVQPDDALAGLATGFPAPQPGAITLEQIMSDPDWIADTPTSWHWAPGGDAAHYRRRKPETELTDLYIHPIDGQGTVVPDERIHAVINPGNTGDGATDRGGNRRVVSKGGDLFLIDLRTDAVRQLTRTSASESGPMFLNGDAGSGDEIAYRAGSNWMIRDLGTGDIRQAADVRFQDAPKDDGDDEGSYLDRQQQRLFETLSDRRARTEERRARTRELRELDPTRPAGPFYLGARLASRGSWLSPSGHWMLVTGAPSAGDSPRDLMPRYVNDDGYVDTVRVRPKVGLQKFSSDRVFVLNLVSGEHVEIDLEQLPGIRDAFRVETRADGGPDGAQKKDAETEADDPADANDASVGEGADEPAGEKKGQARKVRVMRAAWSPDGRYAALMIEAVDNKDRWTIVVDAAKEEEGFTLVERLRDEAWINWAFNEMGWLRRSPVERPTLWFLSEASGYSHLHTFSPEDDAPRTLTEGEYEIASVVESIRGGLYFRMNRDSPVEFEIGSIDPRVPTPRVRAVTDMGGTVSSFRLSPDGSRILFEWSSAITPPELYTIAAVGRGTPERLTETASPEYLGLPWVDPEILPIASSVVDRPIWTKVYRVPGSWSPADGPRPGVVFVHGAGYTQNSDNQYPFYFREQMFHSMLAHLGYVVIDMDYRASAGYGRDWRTAIARHMGKPELEDLRDGVDWMVETHSVDRSRIGVYGGSYGGFMTLYAMFVDPQLFAAGASLRPVTDWAHYNHGYTSNILNTPQLDPEAYERSSPIELAEGLENPLLICHGMLDDNVVFQDTARLAQRLIELEKEDWEVAIYPMEPHGFVHASAWLDQYRRIFKLFERHLRDAD